MPIPPGVRSTNPTPQVGERVILPRTKGVEGWVATMNGHLKSPVSVPVKKSVVGPVQLFLDEMSGIFSSESL